MSEPKGAQGPTMEEILASIRKMIPDEEEAPAPEAGPLAAGAPETNELVLTQMLAEDGSLVRLAAPSLPKAEDEALLLTETAPPGPAVSAAASLSATETVEAFVRRALEPQIQAWLEAHLPAMVERMVQDVIDGIRRKSEKDKPSS
jgi:cell pole-organizing protein PopZ